jgi:FAD/FMN-containing dehydrogenase
LGLALLENDRAISHGDCPSVGLAGHSLHGGFGYTSRMWGLSTDAIHGLEVVTATGDVEYCDDKKNPDLYWVSIFSTSNPSH